MGKSRKELSVYITLHSSTFVGWVLKRRFRCDGFIVIKKIIFLRESPGKSHAVLDCVYFWGLSLKTWIHIALGCNHQSITCPSYNLHVQLLWYPNLWPGLRFSGVDDWIVSVIIQYIRNWGCKVEGAWGEKVRLSMFARRAASGLSSCYSSLRILEKIHVVFAVKKLVAIQSWSYSGMVLS